MLDAMFFQSVSVPRSIRRLAHASLSPIVFGKDGEIRGEVSHGQMMGAYLSFPLLCLQSYVAARWASRDSGRARFLVNGDDCVISSERPVGRYPDGFRLNDKKTIRAKNVVEVNSTTFLRRTGKWREIRHLRRGGFCSDWHGLHHASAAVRFSRRWTTALVRCRFGQKWGFLPSQIGLRSDAYGAFQRQRTMLRRRVHTDLPAPPLWRDETLRPMAKGEPWDDRARSALRSHLMLNGRKVGKRDSERWSPGPIGVVRRTYAYRKRCRPDFRVRPGAVCSQTGGVAFGSCLSFQPGDDRLWCKPSSNSKLEGFVPLDFESTSELEGRLASERFARLWVEAQPPLAGGV